MRWRGHNQCPVFASWPRCCVAKLCSRWSEYAVQRRYKVCLFHSSGTNRQRWHGWQGRRGQPEVGLFASADCGCEGAGRFGFRRCRPLDNGAGWGAPRSRGGGLTFSLHRTRSRRHAENESEDSNCDDGPVGMQLFLLWWSPTLPRSDPVGFGGPGSPSGQSPLSVRIRNRLGCRWCRRRCLRRSRCCSGLMSTPRNPS